MTRPVPWLRVQAAARRPGPIDPVVDVLGPALAPWVLSNAGWEAARASETLPGFALLTRRPSVPEHRGACGALIACREACASPASTWLAPAFVLPLQWRRHAGGGPPGTPAGLAPAALTALARQVREALAAPGPQISYMGDLSGFELGLHEELSHLDLSDWEVEPDSAWVALAGGLVLASWEGAPRFDVFATACWQSGEGLRGVGYFEEKIAAVRRHHGRRLFVAAVDYPTAVRLTDEEGVQEENRMAQTLPVGRQQPWRAIEAYLAPLEVPAVGSREEVLKYWTRQRFVFNSRSQAPEYYEQTVLPVLAEGVRRRGIAGWRSDPGSMPDLALALVHSGDNCELTLLLVDALKPKFLLLCHTLETQMSKKEKEALNIVRKRYPSTPPGCEHREFRLEAEQELFDKVVAWGRDLPDLPIAAMEVTGGTKPMTVMLAWAAEALSSAGRKCVVLYLDSKKEGGTRAAPGTESLRCIERPGGPAG